MVSARSAGWRRRLIDEPQSEQEPARLPTHLRRGRPFGNEAWQRRMVG